MSTESIEIKKIAFDPVYTAQNGPARIDRRTSTSGLRELAAGFFDFELGGATEPWTLPYEEVLLVVIGVLTVHPEGADQSPVIGEAGDVITLPKGTTVRYEGVAHTRVFFSLVPADWLTRSN